jgi:hypothetical protein
MAPCIIIGERAAEALRNEHGLETSSVSRSAKVDRSRRSDLLKATHGFSVAALAI